MGKTCVCECRTRGWDGSSNYSRGPGTAHGCGCLIVGRKRGQFRSGREGVHLGPSQIGSGLSWSYHSNHSAVFCKQDGGVEGVKVEILYCPTAIDLGISPVLLKGPFSWRVGNSLCFLSHQRGDWNDFQTWTLSSDVKVSWFTIQEVYLALGKKKTWELQLHI